MYPRVGQQKIYIHIYLEKKKSCPTVNAQILNNGILKVNGK